jgi:hypothetical protein
LAKKRLDRAKKLITAGNPMDSKSSSQDFYCEVSRALLQYLGDKLNLSAHGLTKDRIVSELTVKGVKEENISQLLKLLDSCDFARFAPGSSSPEEMNEFLSQAEEVMVKLEE